MTIMARKMLFQQKLWHRWKAFDLSFLKQHLKQQDTLAENVVVLSYDQLMEGR